MLTNSVFLAERFGILPKSGYLCARNPYFVSSQFLSMFRNLVLSVLLLTITSEVQLHATDLYTSSECALYNTIKEARELHRKGDSTTIAIHLAPGKYFLGQTLTLRPEDSHIRLIGACDPSGCPTVQLSGGVELKNWRREGKLWSCPVPEYQGRPLEFRQLYVNGNKAVRAKDVSQWDDMTRVLSQDRLNQVLYVPTTPALKQLIRQGVGHAEMVLHEMWCVSVLRIASLTAMGDSVAVRFHQPEAELQFSHPWPSPLCHDRPEGWNASPFYLTNHKALLDEPGEWYLDLLQQRVYYYPRSNEKIEEAIVPVTETLLAVEGTLDKPVEDISIENISFCHSTWLRPSLQGHVPLQAGMPLTEAYQFDAPMARPNNFELDNQGWLDRPAAAVSIRGARDIRVNKCRFEHLGSSAIDFVWGTQGGAVTYCKFADIAGNGVVAGSFSPSSWETHQAYDPSDRREVVTGLRVAHNEIQHIGTEDWGCVAIAAGYVAEMSIDRNTIHDVPYTAISLGWGWNADKSCMHDNKVFNNDIRQFALHMYDCAGIYTLGNQPGTEIYRNHISDIGKPSYAHDPDHWFWLYTDEGSSNIYVHDNLCPSDKFLQNANGPCNTWMNNVQPILLTPDNNPKATDLMLREENKPRWIPVEQIK